MSRRYEVGTAGETRVEVLTSPEDVEDEDLADSAAGERALVIGKPWGAASAITGQPEEIRPVGPRVVDEVDEAFGGDVMPAEVDGMPVMSVFRQLPAYGRLNSTWLVILREALDPAGGNRYRLCR